MEKTIPYSTTRPVFLIVRRIIKLSMACTMLASMYVAVWNSPFVNASEYSQEEIEYERTSINTIVSSAKGLIQQTAIMVVRAEKDGRIPTEVNGVKSTVAERVELWGSILRRFQDELEGIENRLEGLDSMDEETRKKLAWEAFKLESAATGLTFRIGVLVGIQKLVPIE